MKTKIRTLQVVPTSYSSLPVVIPESFLAPLKDPSVIETKVIDFAKTPLPAYKDFYAVILDNVLSRDECDQLIKMAEMSAGAHTDGKKVENNGWRPAMVNAGVGQEFMAPDYRNSDRIIWDNDILVKRLWERVLQGDGIKEYISKLEGEKYRQVIGGSFLEKGIKWHVTEQGINERMRFLKYGAGQFFRSRYICVSISTKKLTQWQVIVMVHTVHLMGVRDHFILCTSTSTTRRKLSGSQKEQIQSLGH